MHLDVGDDGGTWWEKLEIMHLAFTFAILQVFGIHQDNSVCASKQSPRHPASFFGARVHLCTLTHCIHVIQMVDEVTLAQINAELWGGESSALTGTRRRRRRAYLAIGAALLEDSGRR